MAENKKTMIDLLHHVYMEKRSKSDTKALELLPGKVVSDFKKGKKTDLDYKQQWLLHKYFHSVCVLEAGLDIIYGEEKLRFQPQKIKQDWCDALLMHDIGRAYEVNYQGKRILKYPHGTLGMEMLHRQGIQSPHILLPILMHDRIHFDIFALKPEEIMTDSHFANVPDKVKGTIKSLMEQYYKMDKKEQEAIRLGCRMLVDADQLANLKDFDKMLNLSRYEKRPEISQEVRQAIKEGHLVNYKDLKTYPDEAVAYMAWMFDGNFPSFRNELVENDLLNKMRHFVIKKMIQNDPTKDFKDLDIELQKMQRIVEKNIHSKMRPFDNNAKEFDKEKQRVLGKVLQSRAKGK